MSRTFLEALTSVGKNLQSGVDKLKETKATYYDTIAELKNDTNIFVGQKAVTLGYYSANDGGGAHYVIREKTDSDTDDGGSILVLDDEKVAELVIYDNQVTIEAFGASTIQDDNAPFFKAAFKYCAYHDVSLVVPAKGFVVASQITVPWSAVNVKGLSTDMNPADSNARICIYYTGTDSEMINIQGPGWKFSDLTLKGEGTNIAFVCDCSRAVFERCFFYNFEEAIRLTNTSTYWHGENKIINNYFSTCVAAIKTQSVTKWISDNIIRDNVIINGTNFIIGNAAAGFMISDNHDYSSNGINISNIGDTLIQGNYFDNNTNTSITLSVSRNISIVGNLFYVNKTPTDSFNKVELSAISGKPTVIIADNILSISGDDYTYLTFVKYTPGTVGMIRIKFTNNTKKGKPFNYDDKDIDMGYISGVDRYITFTKTDESTFKVPILNDQIVFNLYIGGSFTNGSTVATTDWKPMHVIYIPCVIAFTQDGVYTFSAAMLQLSIDGVLTVNFSGGYTATGINANGTAVTTYEGIISGS